MWEQYHATSSHCSVCGSEFQIQFRYQVRQDASGVVCFCSQKCLQDSLTSAHAAHCEVCEKPFEVEFPYQVQAGDYGARYFCSLECVQGAKSDALPSSRTKRIAVFNHKGGTGKTTTAINIAAGFAELGKKVLLIDADGQGNVGASLGIRGEHTLYHILVHGRSLEEVAIPVRTNLDVVTSNELLAAAELHLAARPNRDRVLRERLGAGGDAYDVVVPVSCDYLSLVGVKQVLKTIKNVRELLKHDVNLVGVLPTFYDVRNKICREAVDALTDHFGERCLPPIRVNTKLKEAPSAKQTIFEYAPDSHGALDYRGLVEHLLSVEDAPVTEEALNAATFSVPAMTTSNAYSAAAV